MSDQTTNDIAVDRRQETVVTQQPGYMATEQVVRDVAAERRMVVFQINRIIWTVLGALEALLAVRFFLKLIGANSATGFAMFIYGVTDLFTLPFANLVQTWASGASVLEVTTLIAMTVYALAFWGIVSIIPIITDRPSARSVSRSTHEATPGPQGQGRERTTYTVSRD